MDNRNNFHYVAILLDLLYGIELEVQDLEELGLLAWEKIGNREIQLYRYQASTDADNSIELPCNAVLVEAVTTLYEDWNRITNTSGYGDLSSVIESQIEADKTYTSPYYIPGKLVNFTLVGNTLYFPRNYGTLNILYKGIIVDEDGLPYLTDKEATAIATYIAYVTKYKEGLVTNNANIISLSNSLYGIWSKQCDLARVVYLNQNDFNSILDVRGSWDRKAYGLNHKVLKV